MFITIMILHYLLPGFEKLNGKIEVATKKRKKDKVYIKKFLMKN